MKITVKDFDEATDKTCKYVSCGYRVTYTSATKIVLQRLPNPKFAKLAEEITINVRSSSG